MLTTNVTITSLTKNHILTKTNDPDAWLEEAIKRNEYVTVENWTFDEYTGAIVVNSLYPTDWSDMESLYDHLQHEYETTANTK